MLDVLHVLSSLILINLWGNSKTTLTFRESLEELMGLGVWLYSKIYYSGVLRMYNQIIREEETHGV